MSLDISMQIIGLQKLINAFDQGPEERRRQTDEGFDTMMAFIIQRIQANTPVHRGTLRDAWAGEITFSGAAAEIKAEGIPEAVVLSVEHGAKPHWPPWGPGSALAQWANAKGIPPFLVARAIARKGTIKRYGYKGARMIGKGLEESQTHIAAESQRIGERIVGELFV